MPTKKKEDTQKNDAPEKKVLKKCNACGKVIETEKGYVLQAASGRAYVRQGLFSDEFAKKNLGGYKAGKTYRVCYECYFKSMGVKP